MAQSITKIWIHAVWATKDLQSLISPRLERRLFAFISDEFNELGCNVRIINGMSDHVHCLFLLNPQKSLSEVIKHIKGGSSHYVNYHNLIPQKFAWKKGYSAFAVSDSAIENTLSYIKIQKSFHLAHSFPQEVDQLLKVHNLDTFLI